MLFEIMGVLRVWVRMVTPSCSLRNVVIFLKRNSFVSLIISTPKMCYLRQ